MFILFRMLFFKTLKKDEKMILSIRLAKLQCWENYFFQTHSKDKVTGGQRN